MSVAGERDVAGEAGRGLGCSWASALGCWRGRRALVSVDGAGAHLVGRAGREVGRGALLLVLLSRREKGGDARGERPGGVLRCGTAVGDHAVREGRSVGRRERWWRLLGQQEWFCGLSCRGKKGAGPRWEKNQDEMVWAEVEFEPTLGWAWVFLFFYFLCFSNSNHSTISIQKQIQIQP